MFFRAWSSIVFKGLTKCLRLLEPVLGKRNASVVMRAGVPASGDSGDLRWKKVEVACVALHSEFTSASVLNMGFKD